MLLSSLFTLIILMSSNIIAFLTKNPIHISQLCISKIDSELYAHKTGTGNTKNNRDSRPNYLGLKKFHNMFVYTGNIIVRQRGAHFKPGIGAKMGRDFTIYASRSGRLQILKRRVCVLDLIAEREYFEGPAKKIESPVITTLSKIWTKKPL